MSVGILVAGTVGALFTSFGIGANDVANAFGTSVGAKVLSLKQAMIFAGIFEFLGAFLMGSHVSDTVRKGIVNAELYADAPNELMLGMLCALLATGVWLLIATFAKLPVSTTHSIIGAILGFAIATRGAAGVNWIQIILVVASWVISPVLSGILSAGGFVAIRKLVLRKPNSPEAAVNSIPYLLAFAMLVNTFFVIYKGSPGLGLKNTPLGIGILVSLLVAAAAGLVGKFFLAPHTARKVAKIPSMHMDNLEGEKNNDLEKNMPSATPTKADSEVTKDAEEAAEDATEDATSTADVVVESTTASDEPSAPAVVEAEEATEGTPAETEAASEDGQVLAVETPDVDAPAPTPRSDASGSGTSQGKGEDLAVTSPTSTGPLAETKEGDKAKSSKKLSKFETELHGEDPDHFAHSEVFDSRAEATFGVLQVLTACFAAFAHGSNDLANAIGPYAAIYGIYTSGVVNEENNVPAWMLAMGGAGIVLGLGVLGYKVILTIGRNLTKITPSRGFNIELGAALTVVIASRIGVPVSTSHSQVGSVIGVGRVDGGAAVNWGLFRNIAISWLVTLPFTGLLTAALFGILWNIIEF